MAFLSIGQRGWRRCLIEEADVRRVALHIIDINMFRNVSPVGMLRNSGKRRDFRGRISVHANFQVSKAER